MSVTLKQFESITSDKIRRRGRKYYRNGRVRSLSEQESGIWTGIVHGTVPYRLEIHLGNQHEIEKVGCNCPYDYGLICKHLAAVFYTLRERLYGDASADGENGSGVPAREIDMLQIEYIDVKRKSDARQIEERLESLSDENVRDYLKSILLDDPRLRTEFLIDFQPEDRFPEKQEVRRWIRDVLMLAGYRDYDYNSQSIFTYEDAGPLYRLVDLAAEYEANGFYEQMLDICLSMLDEALHGDYEIYLSGTHLQSVLDGTFDLLFGLADINPDSAAGQRLFEYCLHQYQNAKKDLGKYRSDYLNLARFLAHTSQQYEKLEALLWEELEELQQEETYYGNEYRIEQRVQDLMQIYGEQGKTGPMQKLLDQFRGLSGIRRILIEQALDRDDYEEVEKLAREGRRLNEEDGGRNKQWTRWLLEVAREREDIEEQRSYCRELLMETRQFEWYQQLKSLYEETEWEDISEDIIDRLHESSHVNVSLMASIYAEEKQWEDLLTLARHDFNLGMLDRYSRLLADKFYEEWVEIYKNLIDDFLRRNKGRGNYQAVCEDLDTITRLGDREDARKIATYLREEFSNRPALKDELHKGGY